MSAPAKTTHARRHEISPRQIKAIHAAKNKTGMDQEVYWARLRAYGCKDRDCKDKLPPHPTSKDLTWQQAEELLDSLNGKRLTPPPSGHLPLNKGGTGGVKQYSDLDGRPGFASGAQCRLVAAMFAQVTKAPADDPDAREKALNSFCYRISGVAALRMVRTYQVEKIVKALEAMGAVHKGGNHA